MPRELELRVVKLAQEILSASVGKTPNWLVRPGRAECLDMWRSVCQVYTALSGLQLPEVMRSVERRTVDAVLIAGQTTRILEVNEKQHFNVFRAETIARYPKHVEVAFDLNDWLRLSVGKTTLERGGFARPAPPLFPGPNGRHKQRAFRDALCDLLPPLYGYAPTLRISQVETKAWIWGPNARAEMAALLTRRLGQNVE